MNIFRVYIYIPICKTGKFGDLVIDIGISKIKTRHILPAVVDVTCLRGSWIRRQIKIPPIFLKPRFGVKSANVLTANISGYGTIHVVERKSSDD